jgi:hypothetical protein
MRYQGDTLLIGAGGQYAYRQKEKFSDLPPEVIHPFRNFTSVIALIGFLICMLFMTYRCVSVDVRSFDTYLTWKFVIYALVVGCTSFSEP